MANATLSPTISKTLTCRESSLGPPQSLALPSDDPSEEGPAFADLVSREPDPEFAAQVAEEWRRLLARLDAAQRSVALWKMEGYTNEEIASKLGRSLATVERKLRMIRTAWEKEVTP